MDRRATLVVDVLPILFAEGADVQRVVSRDSAAARTSSSQPTATSSLWWRRWLRVSAVIDVHQWRQRRRTGGL